MEFESAFTHAEHDATAVGGRCNGNRGAWADMDFTATIQTHDGGIEASGNGGAGRSFADRHGGG